MPFHILAIKNPYNKLEKDLITYLKITDTTKVAFIGFIKPLVKRVNSITKFTVIVDDNPFIYNYSNN